MPPTQLTWHFCLENPCTVFTLGNRCIPCYVTHTTYAECQRDLSGQYSTNALFEFCKLNLSRFTELVWFGFIIIITHRHRQGYPWPSLTTFPYRPLLPAGLQGYIPYQHRATVCRFKLVVLPLLFHVKGSTGVYHIVSTSPPVPHVCGSCNLDSFRDGGRWPYSCCFVGCCLLDLFDIARSILL